ncbi:MAG TPA: 3-ketoacyl-ACP reductase [Phycisphaerae bacterium]|nr:3-ketoacyl-ACP reductase [Phycisphaerae bacterium]
MDRRPVAFVTGAGRGIGRGIAIELARCGYDVAGDDTSYAPDDRQHGLGEVQIRVEEAKAAFLPVVGDIACLEAHQTMLDTVLRRFGAVDVLVNNAGVAPSVRRDVLEATPESFDRVVGVNARGTFFLTQCVARQMVRQTQQGTAIRPAIVFITSVSADASSPSRAEYCISKAAASQAARVFADRLAEFGINVYEVRPGIIQTGMTAPVKEKYDALIAGGLAPQRRWGLPEDVGRAVAALVRGDFAYSTGMIMEVSGGMNIRRL